MAERLLSDDTPVDPLTIDIVPTGDPTPRQLQDLRQLRRGPRRRWWQRRSVRVIGALVVVVTGYYLITLYQVWSTGRSDQTRAVDAIVVMGAAQYDGRPSPLLAARLDRVVELWQQDITDTVVVTGGKLEGDRFTEAEASQRYLEQRGIPESAFLAEDRSHNSYDALRGVADLLSANGKRTVLVVTDPFHSLRSRLIAEEVGLTAYVAPTHTSPVRGTTLLWREMKEAAGISLGRIIGFERLTGLTG